MIKLEEHFRQLWLLNSMNLLCASIFFCGSHDYFPDDPPPPPVGRHFVLALRHLLLRLLRVGTLHGAVEVIGKLLLLLLLLRLLLLVLLLVGISHAAVAVRQN